MAVRQRPLAYLILPWHVLRQVRLALRLDSQNIDPEHCVVVRPWRLLPEPVSLGGCVCGLPLQLLFAVVSKGCVVLGDQEYSSRKLSLNDHQLFGHFALMHFHLLLIYP